MLLLILLASLFELCLTSNIHRDRWLTWGEERLSAAERIWFSPSYLHLLKPSLIEEILLTAQSSSAHYALMISPLFQSVLFDYTSTDTNFLAQNTAEVHENYSWQRARFSVCGRAGTKAKNIFNKTFKKKKEKGFSCSTNEISKGNMLGQSLQHNHTEDISLTLCNSSPQLLMVFTPVSC